jgi:hypothetical protein
MLFPSEKDTATQIGAWIGTALSAAIFLFIIWIVAHGIGLV